MFGMGTGGTPPPLPPELCRGLHRDKRRSLGALRWTLLWGELWRAFRAPVACLPSPRSSGGAVKVSTDSYPSAQRVATRTLRADQPGVLPGVLPP